MIAICTPSRDVVQATFAYDLVRLIQRTDNVVFTIALGSLLPNLRTFLVRESIKNGVSHILFIDSDMRFPEDAAIQLLEHKLDIVGANCQQRIADQTTAFKDGKFISSRGKSEIEEVDSIGFGVTLIKIEVFNKVSAPWFATPYDGEKFATDDVFFCKKAKEFGFKIFTDHKLSHKVGHTGSKEFYVE
jgi:hypothetical protein